MVDSVRTFVFQHGGEVRDVRGGQAQRLYLAQLAVDRLRGDELAQVVEGAVHALSPAALSLVGGPGDRRRRLLCNGRRRG